LLPDFPIELSTLSGALILGLADLLIKSTVIMLTAAMACILLRKSAAAVRHRIWSLAVCTVLFLPVFGNITPRMEIPLLERNLLLNTSTFIPANDSHADPVIAQLKLSDPDRSPLDGRGEAGLLDIDGTPPVREIGHKEITGVQSDIPLPILVAFSWITGVVFVLLLLLINLTIARKILRSAVPAGPSLKRIVLGLVNQVGIRRRVRLSVSSSALAPFTYGIGKPAIILRDDESSRQPDSIEAVLLHELAHIKRHDVLTQTLAQIACVFFWFNPLVWMAARLMRIERELACDDFVLNCGARPSEYARHLLELAAAGRPIHRPFWATAAMARRNHFKERIMSILSTSTNRRGAGRVTSIAIALSAVLITLPIAAMQFWSAPSTTAEAKESLAPVIQSSASEDIIQPKDGDVFKRYRPYLFKIKSMEPLAGVKATFLGREITLREQGDNIWEGITAIGQDAAAGPQTIVLKVSYTDGKVNEYTKTIQIESEPEKTRSVLLESALDLKKRKMMYLNQQKEEELDQLFSHSTENQKWNWPFILPAEGRVSMPFHTTLILDKDKRIPHEGVDLSMPEGTPVNASSTGKVILVEESTVRGNMVVIDHGGGIFTGYMHLSQVSVTRGQEVEQGEVIGLSGSTGISTGPHLHWFLNINGVYCDPMKLFEQP